MSTWHEILRLGKTVQMRKRTRINYEKGCWNIRLWLHIDSRKILAWLQSHWHRQALFVWRINVMRQMLNKRCAGPFLQIPYSKCRSLSGLTCMVACRIAIQTIFKVWHLGLDHRYFFLLYQTLPTSSILSFLFINQDRKWYNMWLSSQITSTVFFFFLCQHA